MAQAVVIDAAYREIAPGYLANRKAELPLIAGLIAGSDFEALRKTGHRLAGSGGSYGFARVSELGRGIEAAALKSDLAVIKKLAAELEAYLSDLELVYE
jgi:hypothetical protein